MEKKYSKKQIFEILSKIDVSKHLEKKDELSYLSWAVAHEFLQTTFDNIEVIEHWNGDKPYFVTPAGCFVKVTLIIEDVEYTETLPVLDGASKPLKDTPYTYKRAIWEKGENGKKFKTGKFEDAEVPAANGMDINKAIKRCFVKAAAIAGLGLSAYKKEFVPKVQGAKIQKSIDTNGSEFSMAKDFIAKNTAENFDMLIEKIWQKYILTPTQISLLKNVYDNGL